MQSFIIHHCVLLLLTLTFTTAVFSAVQKFSGEDVLLDLSVPESVMVFYRSSDGDDDELICNVTQNSLQCKSEYTSRTSLHHPQLTLRGVTSSDSGIYTIRNTDYNDDIHVYAVSVTVLSKVITVVLVVLVVLVVVLLVVIVGLFRRRRKAAAEQELREMIRKDPWYRVIQHFYLRKRESYI